MSDSGLLSMLNDELRDYGSRIEFLLAYAKAQQLAVVSEQRRDVGKWIQRLSRDLPDQTSSELCVSMLLGAGNNELRHSWGELADWLLSDDEVNAERIGVLEDLAARVSERQAKGVLRTRGTAR